MSEQEITTIDLFDTFIYVAVWIIALLLIVRVLKGILGNK